MLSSVWAFTVIKGMPSFIIYESSLSEESWQLQHKPFNMWHQWRFWKSLKPFSEVFSFQFCPNRNFFFFGGNVKRKKSSRKEHSDLHQCWLYSSKQDIPPTVIKGQHFSATGGVQSFAVCCDCFSLWASQGSHLELSCSPTKTSISPCLGHKLIMSSCQLKKSLQ